MCSTQSEKEEERIRKRGIEPVIVRPAEQLHWLDESTEEAAIAK